MKVMTALNSDKIREYVLENYAKPARQMKQARFSVRCGTVEKELGMSNRIAHVCTALRTPKFLDPNGLRLVDVSGPPSGTSTTVVYTYEFVDAERSPRQGLNPSAAIIPVFRKIAQLEGILKDVYRDLGGAENAIRMERDSYSR